MKWEVGTSFEVGASFEDGTSFEVGTSFLDGMHYEVGTSFNTGKGAILFWSYLLENKVPN